MNKRGVSTLAWYIFEILIAGFLIVMAIYFINKLWIPGSQKEDLSKVYFEELNNKIENLGISESTEQIIEFQEKTMLIAFSEQKDTKASVKLKGSTIEQEFTVRKPSSCTKEGCLCLCKTLSQKYPAENDCIGSESMCREYDVKIENDQSSNKIFFLLEEGPKSLKIKKNSNSININF